MVDKGVGVLVLRCVDGYHDLASYQIAKCIKPNQIEPVFEGLSRGSWNPEGIKITQYLRRHHYLIHEKFEDGPTGYKLKVIKIGGNEFYV